MGFGARKGKESEIVIHPTPPNPTQSHRASPAPAPGSPAPRHGGGGAPRRWRGRWGRTSPAPAGTRPGGPPAPGRARRRTTRSARRRRDPVWVGLGGRAALRGNGLPPFTSHKSQRYTHVNIHTLRSLSSHPPPPPCPSPGAVRCGPCACPRPRTWGAWASPPIKCGDGDGESKRACVSYTGKSTYIHYSNPPRPPQNPPKKKYLHKITLGGPKKHRRAYNCAITPGRPPPPPTAPPPIRRLCCGCGWCGGPKPPSFSAAAPKRERASFSALSALVSSWKKA